jgi:hypothetical protein
MSHTHHGRRRRKAEFTRKLEKMTMKAHHRKSRNKAQCGAKIVNMPTPRPGKNATCTACQSKRPRDGVIGRLK